MNDLLIKLELAPPDRQACIADPLLMLSVDVVQRAAIHTALKTHGGNVSQAAKALRINRRTLQRNMGWSKEIYG